MDSITLNGGPADGLQVISTEMPFLLLDGLDLYERIGGRHCYVDPAAVPGVQSDWPLQKLRSLPREKQEHRTMRRKHEPVSDPYRFVQ